MIANEALTSGQIRQAVRSIRVSRPAYTDMLDYYEQLFTAQQDAQGRIQIQPWELNADTVAIKKQEHFPLIAVSDFRIDAKAAGDLLQRICQVTSASKSDTADSAQGLLNAVQLQKIDPRPLFKALLEGDDTVFDNMADTLAIDKGALAFLAYSAIKPSLSVCAEQLSTFLPDDASWVKGYCPVCGSNPSMAVLGTDGERWLCCGFCWHKWSANRIFCPFCENTDSQTLHYFFSESEKGYRVDVCDKCRKYIKTVDTRTADHPIYPPLEQVSTLHLDMLAVEKGLEGGTHMPF